MWKKILVGTDFSEGSQHAAEVAVSLAASLGASVTVAHAWSPPVYPRAAGDAFAMDPGLLTGLEEAIRGELKTAVAPFSTRGVQLDTRSLLGSESASLVELATSGGYDLIVVGTHGRSGLRRILIGSVAERVVRTATVPVLTVRHPVT
jgi:nucleotide-binding universal stress UspA family protein